MAGNSKKKTAPKADEPQRGERLPKNSGGNNASRGSRPVVTPDPVPVLGPWKVVKEGLIWLVIWSCLFLCFDGCRRVIRYGLPSIRFEWVEPDAKTSLGRWILAERPALLKGDFPAVGRALGETARRLRAEELDNMNAAAADTIARAQPEVSDPAQWRTFLSRLGGQLAGGSLEKLAEQYEEAASYFLPKAVQSLCDSVDQANNVSDSPKSSTYAEGLTYGNSERRHSDEESVDEIDPTAGDSGGFVGDERPDESEDIPIGGGEDCGPLPGAEKEGGTADGTPAGCPGENCPRTAAKTYQSNPWYGYGWPWMSW